MVLTLICCITCILYSKNHRRFTGDACVRETSVCKTMSITSPMMQRLATLTCLHWAKPFALGKTLCKLNCMDADRKNALLLAITCIVPAAWLNALLGL